MNKRVRILVLLVLCAPLFLGVCRYARAQSASDPAELIKEGDRLYKEGKYEEAAKLYDEAYYIVSRKSTPLKRSQKLPEKIMEEAETLF
ncbi:MAG: hypothetical protein ABH875_06680 [Candidatus Omnitrophota bacterium]